MTTPEIQAMLRDLKPRSHMLLFYDSTEQKRKILYDYIADGLNAGKGIIYICSDETPSQVRKQLANRIDVEPNEKSGNLLIKYYDEWYIEKGKADSTSIINKWRKAQEAFAEKGLGTRATGEMSCFFKEGKIRDLIRYEYSLHKVLSLQMEALCAYDIRAIVNSGHTELIMPLVRAHGKAIFVSKNGSVVVEPENVEDVDVERLLEIKI